MTIERCKKVPGNPKEMQKEGESKCEAREILTRVRLDRHITDADEDRREMCI